LVDSDDPISMVQIVSAVLAAPCPNVEDEVAV